MSDRTNKECCIDCVSWTSIIAGALVAVGIGFIFDLFGLAIGLKAYTNSPEGHKVLMASGFFGIVVCVMVTMFIGGWVSGFLGRGTCTNKRFGILYGFLTWCVALLISVFITTSAGEFVNLQRNSLAYSEIISKFDVRITNALKNTIQSTDQEHNKTVAKSETDFVAKTLFLTFILFLAGAIMGAYGGYRGLRGKKRR